MEIGNEISQKIRSAIKAKLVDLGAYVDDELPDYIMVMVANKKSQAQMTADLNLFLGDNTERFTAWLHSLLTKLKSIATDPAKEAAMAQATEEASQGDEDGEETMAGEQSTDTNTPAEEQEEPELTLRPDKDEFAEEQIMTEKPKGKSSSSRGPGSTSSTATTQGSKTSHSLRARRPAALAAKAPTTTEPKYEPDSSRKRKMPGSVVTTVTHEEPPEEEYDPSRPMIGRVASMVKVGPRRPTLPPSRQASSALVMKAMTEAQESVEKTANKPKQVERAYVRPMQQRLGSSDAAPAPRGRGRGLARQSSSSREEIHLSSQYTSSARGPASRMRSAAMPAPRRLPQTTPLIKREPLSPSERSVQLLSQTRRDEELQRLQLEADEAEAEARRLAEDAVELEVKRESPEMDWAMEAMEEDKKILELSASSAQSAEVVYNPTPIPQDSRQVRCDPGQEPEPQPQPIIEQRTISVKPRLQSTSSELDMLVEGGADDFDLEDSRRVHESTPIKECPPSPKFVVTLDGVEKEMMQLSEISDVDLQEEDAKFRNIVRVKPQIMMQQQEYYGEEDMLLDEGVSPPKAKRFPDRCKFWPACMKAEMCPFHHPTEPCMKFPKCKFGDKCAYLHPQCRFDGRCTRPDCVYLHTSKGPSAAMPQTNLPLVIQPLGVFPMQSPVDQSGMFFEQPVQPQAQQRPARCKFFPNCNNVECPYVHPKPCRFGAACRNQPHCTFAHPALPTKDQMKWTASKQPSASSSLPPS